MPRYCRARVKNNPYKRMNFNNAPEDFLLIQETQTQTLPFRKWFFVRKRESSQEENET